MTPIELINARKKMKLTQMQLGDKLGLSRESLSRIENGSRPIEKRMALAVRYLLSMSK